MRIYKDVKKIETHKEVVAIKCDRCHKEYSNDYDHDITPIQIEFGYGSKFDTEIWNFDLCDECIEEVFKDIDKKVKR